MDFITLLKNRRSKRKFTTAKVEKDKIELLVQAALMSPTGKKKNHWDFIVVENKITLEQLSFCKPHSASLIAGAPLAIVVIGDPLVSDTWVEDCSIASILIQLAAEDLGLGSCWVQVLHREHNETLSADEYVKNLLGIPYEKMVLSIIAIGYPNESKKLLMQKTYCANEFILKNTKHYGNNSIKRPTGNSKSRSTFAGTW